MKGRSLLGIMLACTMLGAYCLTKPQTANAEPAPMFRPILRDIQTQIPRGWLMRLPSAVNLSDNPLYAKVVTTSSENFAIFLNSQPDCEARFCQLPMIIICVPNPFLPLRNLKELTKLEGVVMKIGQKLIKET